MADSETFIISFVFFVLIAAALMVIIITLRTQSNVALAKMANFPVSANNPGVVSSGKLAPVPQNLSLSEAIHTLTATVILSVCAASIVRVFGKGAFTGAIKVASKLRGVQAKSASVVLAKVIPDAVARVFASVSERLAGTIGIKVLTTLGKIVSVVGLISAPGFALDIADPDHLILPGDTRNAQTASAIRQAVKDAATNQGVAWPIVIGPLTPYMSDPDTLSSMVSEQLSIDIATATEHGEMHPLIHDIVVNAIAEGKTIGDLSSDGFWTAAMTKLNMNTYLDATLANLCVAKGGKSIKLSDGSFACSYTSSNACKSSYGYDPASGKPYAEYYDNGDGAGPVCQYASDAMLKLCDGYGLGSLYDEQKGYCKMDQNTCKTKRMTWNGTTQMCDLDPTQTGFETVFGTYLTRTILSLFTPNGTCGDWETTDGNFCANDQCATMEATLNAKELVEAPYSLLANDMELALGTDGNLVVKDHTNGTTTTVWSTGPGKGSAPFSLALTPGGVLTVADKTGATQWQSTAPTSVHVAPYSMKFLDSGNLSVIDSKRKTVWTANSSQYGIVDFTSDDTSIWNFQSQLSAKILKNPGKLAVRADNATSNLKCVHRADFPGKSVVYTKNGGKPVEEGNCPSGFSWENGACFGNQGYQILTKPSCYNPFNWGKDHCFGADGGWYNDPPCPAGFKYQTLGCQPDGTCPDGYDPVQTLITGKGNFQVCTAKVLGPGKIRDAVTKIGV